MSNSQCSYQIIPFLRSLVLKIYLAICGFPTSCLFPIQQWQYSLTGFSESLNVIYYLEIYLVYLFLYFCKYLSLQRIMTWTFFELDGNLPFLSNHHWMMCAGFYDYLLNLLSLITLCCVFSLNNMKNVMIIRRMWFVHKELKPLFKI